jgi:hypothetical protein
MSLGDQRILWVRIAPKLQETPVRIGTIRPVAALRKGMGNPQLGGGEDIAASQESHPSMREDGLEVDDADRVLA